MSSPDSLESYGMMRMDCRVVEGFRLEVVCGKKGNLSFP